MNEQLREWAARIARGLAGLTAHPGQEGPYRALIAAGETPFRAAEMSRASGCALVAAGFWRAMGVNHRVLRAPYRDQTAVSRLVQIGRERGAVRRPGLDPLPAPGDVCWIGSGRTEHVFVVVESGMRAGDAVVCALDGGQRDEDRCQRIELREHVWWSTRFGVADSARSQDVGASWGATRLLQGWIDLEAVLKGQSNEQQER